MSVVGGLAGETGGEVLPEWRIENRQVKLETQGPIRPTPHTLHPTPYTLNLPPNPEPQTPTLDYVHQFKLSWCLEAPNLIRWKKSGLHQQRNGSFLRAGGQ